MENYIKIKEAKPNNNEYVLLHTSVHDSKPKKLLYTNDEFIDFEMKPVSVEDDNYWRPVYGNNPITNHRSEIVTKKSDVPEGSQVDSYASNEYITTYPNKGSRFMYIHKKAEISTRWTGLDDEDLKEAEGLLEEALLTRSERYKLIEDMSISATKTAGVMSGIKKLNSQINGYQNKVNEIKRQVGYHEDEILKSEKRKQTI